MQKKIPIGKKVDLFNKISLDCDLQTLQSLKTYFNQIFFYCILYLLMQIMYI